MIIIEEQYTLLPGNSTME